MANQHVWNVKQYYGVTECTETLNNLGDVDLKTGKFENNINKF